MSAPAPHPILVRTFMTHDMKDEDIAALSTGRDDEFRRIMEAIARSRRASPGAVQHIVVYGSRGFGKSFMARRAQIAVADLDQSAGPVRYVLLPEEQHNLQRSPHAFLETIALRIENLEGGGDDGYAAAHFQWPRPGEEAKRWDRAAADLETALDAAFPDGDGLVIVVVENVDILLATLFKEEEDEQRLRLWLDRKGNRLMLFATATGTVDIDYERPLFKAFETVRLSSWTAEDCIDYFNRQRAHEGRPPLDADQAAKARAVAEFIGGTPRLAQLLAAVLDTQDALSVAETMSALADKLAEYYRRRIEDLPPLGRGLLDALIRAGEPASQTALAARVSADGQNEIARAMGDLQLADIVRGRRAPDSRETLYSVTDRVFVHYYRLRQGSLTARATPLETILDFLKGFYSRDEQRAQALRYLEIGRPAEAELFSRLALESEGHTRNSNDFAIGFGKRLKRYAEAATDTLGMDLAAIATIMEDTPAEVHELCRHAACAAPLDAAIVSIIRSQSLHRMGLSEQSRAELEIATEAEGADAAVRVIVGSELVWYLRQVANEVPAADVIGPLLQSAASVALPSRLTSWCLRTISLSLSDLARHDQAVDTARRAVEMAAEADDKREKAESLRRMASSLGQLGRLDEAVETARRAAELAGDALDKREEAILLRHMAISLWRLGRHDEAVEAAGRAATLAGDADDKREEAISRSHLAFFLCQLDRHDEAVESARRAADLARKADDKREEAVALRHMAFSLWRLERYDDAWTAAADCIAIARPDGDRRNLSCAMALAIIAAAHVPRPQAITLFEEWLEAWRSSGGGEIVFDPGSWIDDLFIAAARAHAFGALDALLDEHGDSLVDATEGVFFHREDGENLADIALTEGRAEACEAVAGLLPRIAAFMRRLPSEKRDETWLPDMISGFAGACRDPGTLRDVAALLTDDLAPQAEDSQALLRALADVDEADDAEAALARMDPDRATLIRRLRDLPDPKPIPPKRKAKRNRKMPSD